MNNLFKIGFILLILAQCKNKKTFVVSPPNHIDFSIIKQDTWTCLGPFGAAQPIIKSKQMTPMGSGRFMCINQDPDNEKILFAGHASSGLYKTINKGISWQKIPLPDNISTGISKIIRLNHNKKHLFAAASLDLGKYKTYGYGLIESKDGGVTWIRNNLTFTPKEYDVSMIIDLKQVGNKKENTIYALSKNKLWKSIDEGISWQQIYETAYILSEIQVDPFNEKHLTIGGNCLLQSFDGGMNWEDLSFVLNQNIGKKYSKYARIGSGFSKLNNGLMYVVSESEQCNFFKIINGKQIEWQSANYIWNSLARLEIEIQINLDKKSETIWVGTTKIHKSIDTKKFEICGEPIYGQNKQVHDDINEIYIGKNNEVFICTDGGIDVSSNQTCNWQSITNNSVNLSGYLIFGFDFSEEGILMAGTQDQGIIRLMNGHWQTCMKYGDGGRVVNLKHKEEFCVGFSKINLITKDAGEQFENAEIGINEIRHDHRIEYNRWSEQLYVGNMQLYRQSKGKYFEIISSKLKPTNIINAIWINPKNSDEIWMAREEPYWTEEAVNKLFYTENGGITWQDKTANFPILRWRTITDINVNDEGDIGFSLALFDKNEHELNKVYFSKDKGKTFENVSTGLPNLPINCLKFIKGKWYCGSNSGIHVLNNGIWSQFGNESPIGIVTEIKFDSKTSNLLISTFGRGIWGIRLN